MPWAPTEGGQSSHAPSFIHAASAYPVVLILYLLEAEEALTSSSNLSRIRLSNKQMGWGWGGNIENWQLSSKVNGDVY